jgi:hypothetical protein
MQYLGIYPDSWKFSVAMLGLNIVLLSSLASSTGDVVRSAYSRLDKRNLAKLRGARYERAHLEPATTDGGAD